ncbi:histidinol-phosphate transaminase [Enterococcus columbae]|uniref:Histidinol-phosphate aminotransferase n=1 Tax=Enterococcus columbae DSM 7374 = ATCC 51263 TaxID=1121865 RepID=S0KY28_9ENTE|nr:histidinol-phosphate transaminase [Enterococcus columbae]EOT44176.1 histidinol-phosphate transaminase [Enterococcus columbae DSM 7374 = ATCC 51263]EOW84334.1 histidinol-phosphate transaminase [Enterococcus columbae DSM 7374 = ATCC 51263]
MSFFNQKYHSLIPYTPGEQVNEQQILKLNTNENPYDPPQAVLEAAKQAAMTLSRYSDPTCRMVRQPLAKQLGVKEEQIFIGNGSDDVLALLFQGFTEHGVAFPDISYGFYDVYRHFYQVPAKIVPLNAAFQIDLADYEGSSETVVIANPNAPTGLVISKERIIQFLSQNPHRLLIVDEAYADFGKESVVQEVAHYPNLIVVGTFSKARQLAGARLGYAIANEQIIQDMNRLKFSINPYSVNTMSLYCGAASLNSQDYVDECIEKIITTREYVCSALQQLSFEVLPSQANFIFATHPKITGQHLYQRLKQDNIYIRWFDQERIRNFIRISIGTQEEMVYFIEKIKEILQEENIHA